MAFCRGDEDEEVWLHGRDFWVGLICWKACGLLWGWGCESRSEDWVRIFAVPVGSVPGEHLGELGRISGRSEEDGRVPIGLGFAAGSGSVVGLWGLDWWVVGGRGWGLVGEEVTLPRHF